MNINPAGFVSKVKEIQPDVPMHLETDREAIEVALGSTGVVSSDESRIVRIKNTLHLQEVEVSQAFEKKLRQRSDQHVSDGPRPMTFNHDDNLVPL